VNFGISIERGPARLRQSGGWHGWPRQRRAGTDFHGFLICVKQEKIAVIKQSKRTPLIIAIDLYTQFDVI